MAWNGPAAGTAQYQPPFTSSQPAFGQQQPYQYGQQANYGQFQGPPAYPPNGQPQRAIDFRTQKKKGNPIITRYPPPPGYRGPAQPQAPYATSSYQGQYQSSPQQYQPGYPGASGYQNPAYPPSTGYPQHQGFPPQPPYNSQQSYPPNQSFPQQGYQQGQSYPQSQPSYPPAQSFSQPQNYQAGQGYAQPQTSYNGFPPQPAFADPHQSPHSSNQAWHQPNGLPYSVNEQHNSYGGQPIQSQSFSSQDANATPTPTSAQPASAPVTSGTAAPSGETVEGEKPPLFLAWDDWDFDFDGAIWPKSNEPVDPALSLGVIIWRPAKQVTRALASTYDDAEEHALKPPPEKLGNGESVSIYFSCENSHEAYLDVRQTDEWYRIRRDPIFVVFPNAKNMELIPVEDCLNKRDRPDWPVDNIQEGDDAEMEDSDWNVMDNLEQALSGQDVDAKLPSAKEKQPHQTQTQEDILAMLGVTGSPKPPSNEPAPVPFPPLEAKIISSLPEKPVAPPMQQIPPRPEHPPAPQRAHSYGGHRNSTYGPPPQRLYGSISSSQQRPPPPPPPPPDRGPSWTNSNPQVKPNGYNFDRSQTSPARSETSNRTLAGSDFEVETNADGAGKVSEAVPKVQRSDSSFSRKRSYDDTDQDEKLRQQDDHIRRKRRQPEVAAAYSRR
ncbi:hypothetical protein EJ04DRAFT_509149 [Polyplosphaeria fusca]|uniref:Uncharacterized protein n=1 Tax=Polyplosphaeria fusca TaxID=682080 RepID=A0A9P4R6I6_9PLEO|nr:hypothetical protein EJ04DRAFT_509149 [Polyplosphaeria fusca]